MREMEREVRTFHRSRDEPEKRIASEVSLKQNNSEVQLAEKSRGTDFKQADISDKSVDNGRHQRQINKAVYERENRDNNAVDINSNVVNNSATSNSVLQQIAEFKEQSFSPPPSILLPTDEEMSGLPFEAAKPISRSIEARSYEKPSGNTAQKNRIRRQQHLRMTKNVAADTAVVSENVAVNQTDIAVAESTKLRRIDNKNSLFQFAENGDKTALQTERQDSKFQTNRSLSRDETGNSTPRKHRYRQFKPHLKPTDSNPKYSLQTEKTSVLIDEHESKLENGEKPLNFDKEDIPKVTAANSIHDKSRNPAQKRLAKAESNVSKAERRLEKAKENIPKQIVLQREQVFDEKSEKTKSRLKFSKEDIPQNDYLKGSKLTKPLKIGVNAAVAQAHIKMYKAERENVEVQAAHRGAIIVEGAARSAYSHAKTAPYQKLKQAENRLNKANGKLNHEKTISENTKPNKKSLNKKLRKQRYKRIYAKKVRNAKKAGVSLKNTADLMKKSAVKAAQALAKNPITWIIVLLILVFLMLMNTVVMPFASMGGGITGMLAGSYLAEDSDINQAELAYTEWETDLQLAIDNVEETHSGYDEYRYNIGTIGHDPYMLLAYLTAKFQDFTFDEIESELQDIFNTQYELQFDESEEERSDGDGGTYTVIILTTTLTVTPLSDVLSDRMDTDETEMYGVYMETKGNRQYVNTPLAFNWSNRITCPFGYRVHPTTDEKNFHKGVDIAVAEGTPLFAGFDGVVETVGYEAGGYGNYIKLSDGNGVEERFAHCSSINFSEGYTFKKGDIVAYSGNTGLSTGAHLHFEVIVDGEYLNPLFFAEVGS